MKKIILVLVLVLFFSSFLEAFSNPFASTTVKTDIYNVIKNKYENEWNEISSNWIYALAKLYNVDWSYIKNILNWKLIYCSFGTPNLLEQLNIDTWSVYQKEDYLACYKQIDKQFNNYLDTKFVNKELNNSLEDENLLANWKDNDGPYDLVIDVQNLSRVLFKKKMKKIPFWKVLIWKTWKAAAKSLWISKKLWLDKNNNFSALASPVDSVSHVAPTNSINPIASVSSVVPTNSWVSSNPVAPTNSVNNTISSSPNVQIWNQCWNGNTNNINKTINNLKNIDNSNNTSINSDINNLKNINNINNLNWNNSILNNQKQNSLFDTFWWKWDKWWFIDWFFNFNNWWNWLWTLWNWKWGGWWCAWWNKLLSVCFRLIPSWPRWPVWWTTFVNSIEGEIDKIWDSLKAIKQSFIIPAWHGDEALDTDFENLKFANIMAFNIVLTSKPVFNFKKDKKTEKEANVADTRCVGVPHKLAVMYSKLWIAYCLDKWLDKNKYLFTNVSSIKPFPKPNLKSQKNDSSTDGVYQEEKNYSQLLWNVLWFTKSLNKLMWTWLNSSVALEAKSE